MREIKFRAWDKERKDMLYQLKKHPCFGLSEEDRACSIEDVLFYYKEDFELMQYTGLHDKLGKETYEGDILDGSYINPMSGLKIIKRYQVVFKNGTYMAELIGKTPYGDTPLYFKNEKCEVIGNIYENPELLEGEANA